MDNIYFLTILIIVYSTVQSIFGVGLLVFGTPTMLLAGYDFQSTIAFLLPSSMLISLMQVHAGKKHLQKFKSHFLVYSVPFIVLGLAAILTNIVELEIKVLVGGMLVVSAMIRTTRGLQSLLSRFLTKYTKLYLMLMGLIHGLSNMGGGFLTVFITAVYEEKQTIRANIAYGYLVFAISQIAVLSVLNPEVLSLKSVLFAGLALLTSRTVGNLVYLKSTNAVYQHLITAFIFTYGVILIGQNFLF